MDRPALEGFTVKTSHCQNVLSSKRPKVITSPVKTSLRGQNVPSQIVLILKPRLHDTTSCCQTGCHTGCTSYNGCSIVQPVGQPAASCKQISNRLSNRLSNRFYNRLYNRFYNRFDNRIAYKQKQVLVRPFYSAPHCRRCTIYGNSVRPSLRPRLAGNAGPKNSPKNRHLGFWAPPHNFVGLYLRN